ncbi:type II toxin-antitoxin system RelN family antitoxin [Prochlorothrix hollandica]|uniref:type II toxin-antitoxin system RelN family antitoxin n=1 Tax=Prochlorothrix hollandica TaxID=1223 RepID=UPI00333EE48C
MQAIETTATLNEQGQLTLDEAILLPPGLSQPQRVRVIILMADTEPSPPPFDSYDTPEDIVIEGIYQGLGEALSGQTLSLAELWSGIDGE